MIKHARVTPEGISIKKSIKGKVVRKTGFTKRFKEEIKDIKKQTPQFGKQYKKTKPHLGDRMRKVILG
jgi:hypothetical protein